MAGTSIITMQITRAKALCSSSVRHHRLDGLVCHVLTSRRLLLGCLLSSVCLLDNQHALRRSVHNCSHHRSVQSGAKCWDRRRVWHGRETHATLERASSQLDFMPLFVHSSCFCDLWNQRSRCDRERSGSRVHGGYRGQQRQRRRRWDERRSSTRLNTSSSRGRILSLAEYRSHIVCNHCTHRAKVQLTCMRGD